MTQRVSKLFGMDIYTLEGEYRGKVFDLIINLEKGRVETMSTEALRVRTKQEAKRIISEKSIPYRSVRACKDIILISTSAAAMAEDEEESAPAPEPPKTGSYRYRRP